MATRTGDNAQSAAALQSSHIISAELIRVSFGCTDGSYTDQATCEVNSETWADDILITTYGEDLVSDVGEGMLTFESATDLLGMSDIEESLAMDLVTLNLTFSGVTREWLQLSQEVEIINRPVEVWKVLISPDTGEIINAPFKIYAGIIVGGSLVKNPTGEGSAVEVEVSNHFYDFKVLSAFRCNEDDHQKFYPNDTGFKFSSTVERKIKWGVDANGY